MLKNRRPLVVISQRNAEECKDLLRIVFIDQHQFNMLNMKSVSDYLH